jgi:hypothetical protein
LDEAPAPLTVLTDAWHAHPLAWIHRAEARAIADELRATGRNAHLQTFRGVAPSTSGRLLLRLSDPVMLRATRVLHEAGTPYCGPGHDALARCYDKWTAYQAVAAQGIACPRTRFGALASDLPRPLVLKPRRGSDSLGVRVLHAGAVPPRLRNERTLAQPQALGAEVTVGVIDGIAGAPLRQDLPEGTAYTFWRKYLLRPYREAIRDDRAREVALRAARVLGVDWAARVDFIHERGSPRRWRRMPRRLATSLWPRRG